MARTTPTGSEWVALEDGFNKVALTAEQSAVVAAISEHTQVLSEMLVVLKQIRLGVGILADNDLSTPTPD